jgi:putative SOS response-associated peptidase YedK
LWIRQARNARANCLSPRCNQEAILRLFRISHNRASAFASRCLVPASSYCEPKGEKPATWHWFALNEGGERPLFCFPGVWTRYKGPLKKIGETVEQEMFAFMMTEPNELTASINHERIPVLLSDPADFETWLSGSPEEAFKLARTYAAEQMRIVQSGSDRRDLLAAP